ncbi:MAG: alpha-glucosidase [Lachnospiraceae bacterium]|nr:alpha-glucosidase [Lachnospiraceae bacterium]
MRREWWHDKVAYQIYPKSFRDTNGDGIGDLPGIIEKLDYLKDLGVDIVWISPIFCSPMVDNGYDISDYYDIDPMFGTMEDMDQLIEEGKKRGISILLDLVVNHCSSEHEFFKKAMEDPDGPYGQYFYIRDGKDGLPPNNWRSYFGPSAWTKIPGYENKFYLHSYAAEQPDLNWENPEVREKIYEMVCWWMEKGLGGFRIDAIMDIKKDLTWQDLPVDGPDGMGAIYKINQKVKGIDAFLLELRRRCFTPYDGFGIGEALKINEETLKKSIGDGGYFSSIFAFEPCHVYRKGDDFTTYDFPIDFHEWREKTFQNHELIGDIGFEANLIGNHDQPRGASLFIPKKDYGFNSVSALATIIFCQRGLPFIYQGEEIGMTNREGWKKEEYADSATLGKFEYFEQWGYDIEKIEKVIATHSRDNGRTPMQWDDSEHGGFTIGKPWLVVNENYKEINVAAQEREYGSILNFYKRLIAFRKSEEYKEILTYGSISQIYGQYDYIFAYRRALGNQCLDLICNFCGEEQVVELQEEYDNVIFVNQEQTTMIGNRIVLKPYEVVVFEKLNTV